MIRSGTLEQAHSNRRKLTLANGTGYWKSELIASPAGEPLAPQAFREAFFVPTFVSNHTQGSDLNLTNPNPNANANP